MIAVSVTLNQPHNVWKCYLSTVIIYLAQNDFPSAKATFEEHLQTNEYLRTKECEREERLIRIFEDFDEEKWEEMRSGNDFNSLEPQVIKLAKHLSINGGVEGIKKEKPVVKPPPAPVQVQKETPIPKAETPKEETPKGEEPKGEEPKEEEQPIEELVGKEEEEEADYGIDLT